MAEQLTIPEGWVIDEEATLRNKQAQQQSIPKGWVVDEEATKERKAQIAYEEKVGTGAYLFGEDIKAQEFAQLPLAEQQRQLRLQREAELQAKGTPRYDPIMRWEEGPFGDPIMRKMREEASESTSSLPAIVREPLRAAERTGANIVGTVARPFSKDVADYVAQQKEVLGIEAEAQRKGDLWGETFSRLYGGASESLLQATTLAPGGLPAMTAGFALTEANDALFQAEQAGLKGAERLGYAAIQGTIEGGIMSIFNRMGLPGTEGVVTQIAQGTMKNFGKTLLKATAQELPEEVLTDIWHAIAEDEYINSLAIDPNNPGAFFKRMAETVGQTVLTVGMATTAARLTRNQQKLAALEEIQKKGFVAATDGIEGDSRQKRMENLKREEQQVQKQIQDDEENLKQFEQDRIPQPHPDEEILPEAGTEAGGTEASEVLDKFAGMTPEQVQQHQRDEAEFGYPIMTPAEEAAYKQSLAEWKRTGQAVPSPKPDNTDINEALARVPKEVDAAIDEETLAEAKPVEVPEVDEARVAALYKKRYGGRLGGEADQIRDEKLRKEVAEENEALQKYPPGTKLNIKGYSDPFEVVAGIEGKIGPQLIETTTGRLMGDNAGAVIRLYKPEDITVIPKPDNTEIEAALARVPKEVDAAIEKETLAEVPSKKDVGKKPPIVRFRGEAKTIEKSLPPVPEGHVRLWRGNRPGETGRRFTNDLPGIALPFKEAYKGDLTYVDVPADQVEKFTDTTGAAPGAEFTLPEDIAARQQPVTSKTPLRKQPRPKTPIRKEAPEPGVQTTEKAQIAPSEPASPAKEGEAAAETPESEFEKSWAKSRGVLSKEVDLALDKQINRYEAQAQKDEGGRGLAVGAENINYRFGADAVREFRKRVREGMDPVQAADEVKALARTWIAKHNARRPKDIAWQRWEGSADSYIDTAMRTVVQAASPPAGETPQEISQAGITIKKTPKGSWSVTGLPDSEITDGLNAEKRPKGQPKPESKKSLLERIVEEELEARQESFTLKGQKDLGLLVEAPKKTAREKAQDRSKKTQKTLGDAFDEWKRDMQSPSGILPDPKRDAETLDRQIRATVKLAIAAVDHGYSKFKEFVAQFAENMGFDGALDNAIILKDAWDALRKNKGFEHLDASSDVEKILDALKKPDSGETTSVKHAKTDEIREKIGMPPREYRGMSHEEMNAEAARLMRENPELASDLAEEVAHNPHTGSGVEQYILSRHIRDLENRRKAGEDVTDELVTAVTAAKEMGTEAGLALAARVGELATDFSLAGFIKRHLDELDEQPNAKWVARYEELSARVKAAEEDAAASRKRLAEAQAEAAIAKAKQEQSKPVPKKGTKREKLQKRASEAVANFKKAWEAASPFRMGAISDPKQQAEKWFEFTKAAGQVIKAYADLGVNSFLELMSRVKKDIGKLTADQEKAFREAWAKENVASPLGDKPEPSEIGSFAKKLMRLAVESGIEGRDNVVDAVHEELQAAGLEISREDTMLAMSDYGIFRELAKDEVSVKVRAIRGELQQVMKLKDIEAGQIPLRTGVEQRTPSEEESRLRHEVYEGMKRSGFSTRDPSQLTTPLASKKKAVEKRLAKVDEEIQNLTDNIKQRTPLKPDGTRTELKPDEELVNLQAKLDAAYRERDELRKQSPAWQALQETKAREQYEKSLQRRLAFWEERMKTARRGILPEKRKPSKFATEFAEANAKVEEVKNEALAEIEREKRRRWNLGQKIGHGLAEATATLPRELMAGLEMSPVGRQGIFYTHAHPILAFFNVVDSLRSVFSRRYALALNEKLSERANASEYQVAGIEFTREHGPKERTEEFFQSPTMEKLANTKSKYLLPPRLIAKAYRAFERGVRIFSNTMKADLYDINKRDTLAARAFFNKWGMGKRGWDQEDMKTGGRSANILSGRGTGLKPGSTFLDWLFFARRFVWSRVQAEFILPFQLATPKFIGQWNGDSGMRVAHAKLYAQALVGAAAHLAALYLIMKMLADDDPETDDEPTIETSFKSTDVGRVKVGETRIDVLGGMPQYFVLLTRIMSGETKTASGEIKSLRGPDRDWGAPGVWDAANQAFRYKFGPAASGIVDFFTGETAVGQPLPEEPMRRAAGIVGDRLHPMTYPDMWDAEQELGLARGTVTAIEAFFGAGVNTYGPKTTYRKGTEEERAKQVKSLRKIADHMPELKDFKSKENFQKAKEKRAKAKKDLNKIRSIEE